MDIGRFSAGVLARLPVPCVALEVVRGELTSQDDACVVWANPRAREIFGDDIEGAWVDRDQPFGMIGPLAREVELSCRSGQSQVVARVGERDGSVAHLRCTILPVGGGAALMVEDTTVEADARAELAMAGSTLRRVERWGNLGVWELDLDTGSLYWSTQVFEILGVGEPSLDRFYEVVHPDDRAILDHVTERIVEQPGPYRVIHRIVRGGDIRTVEQHMQSVPDTAGRPVRLLGTMIDVTATRALQQQVHESQQMRTLGLLAGGIAHDLANALLIMRGHAEVLLSRSDLVDEARDSVDAIFRGGERASNLTRRFMALGRRDELRPGRINPFGVVNDVRDLVHPVIKPEVDVSIERAEHLKSLRLLADPDRLRQVLLDLVLNARDAGATSVVLRIGEATLEPGDPRCDEYDLAPGHYGLIDVEDNGAGIDPEILERIFDAFFSTKGSDTGSGIGLANAQDFIRQSLGTIWASSTTGVGTTMSVVLPATITAETVPRSTGRRLARRVLVGAASTVRCAELADALSDHGLQVARVDGLDRIGYSLETEPIDVVVLDDSLVPPPVWPDVLKGVPTVVVTSQAGMYPQATHEVNTSDPAGLLRMLDSLLATPSR